jgi:hypothetical protein
LPVPRRADAEHQFGALQRAHIGVLVERAGIDGALAGGYLRGGHLALSLQCRKRQLIVGGERHAHRAIDIRLADIRALLQDAVEVIERAAGLFGRFPANP